VAVTTFTYSYGATSDLNRARAGLGDTDQASALFDDNEITDAVEIGGSWQKAVAILASAQAAKTAREFSFAADGANFQRGQQTKAWLAIAAQYDGEADSGTLTTTWKDGYSTTIDSDDSSASNLSLASLNE